MAKTLITPCLSFETRMLAFMRSVQIDEGLFFATSSKDDRFKTPIKVLEKGVRGQSSEDEAKNPGKSNLQSVEYAVIPQNHDGVELSFSIQFMPFSLKPHACGNLNVRNAYMRLAEGYCKAGGYHVLAVLLAWNIANARFSWRNRYQSSSMKVTVNFGNSQEIVFDPSKLSLDFPETIAGMESALIKGSASDIDAFVANIVHGLSNTDKQASVVDIRWNACMRPGQEIFPSQEYIREAIKETKKTEDQLSRVYARFPGKYHGKIVNQASMHSQKIGAALRHIDIWHDNEMHDEAITVNPYGGVQETGEVLRNGRNSFYALRKNATALLENVENADSAEDISGDVHFVMANLVRGGVFGSKNKSKENKIEASE